MESIDSHFIATTSNMTSIEARDRLHAIMTNDMAETIEQIGQTLEACNMKKARLLEQLDQVSKAVEAVRNECGCIDTTIASKVLHLNKLVTQTVQQMALVNIPDPPPLVEPLPPPTVEIDLSAVHDRLNGLDHMVTNLTKLFLEKEETVLYVINKRPGSGEITASVHSPIRSGDIRHERDEQIHDQMTKLQTIVRSIQNEDQNHSKKMHLHHRRSRQLPHILPPLDDEEVSSHTNEQQNNNQNNNNIIYDDDDDETSRGSDQTTVGPCTLCLQERTEELTTKRSNDRRSIASSNYTDRSVSLPSTSREGGVVNNRGLGEALASNGKEIIYYDYEREMICMAGTEGYSIKFHHGLVVDLCWWSLNNQWLILSEQGLYRWKAGENEYYDAYEFSNGEIGFRRIAVTSTSIFCLFRYSLMLLELSNAMQMKRLHALAPPDTRYRKLADISVRKMIRPDDSEEDVLGLIWFGSGSGILLEERHVTLQANNMHERLFRHVPIQQGRYARLASYEDGRAWLISNTGADVFWIVDNTNVSIGQWEASATWVKVNSGIPINAVGFTDSTVCIRLQDGKLEFLESEH
ncbi:unnamed protein product [Rotaria sp. Silwood2]|nr:unnamed protein product [Rotaria sp. Silwood2]CAF2758260.1 unnamed protein product [Rotaria sp. Silwood2]CAF2928308.1 unnamed protein product [Rotaria sp. Silwood2]CAF3888355.1 unnamed protein product [Rotaria sp. Silwood2]CAF3942398.1 unnamed protein product [Rotaria sp. Silwood2]